MALSVSRTSRMYVQPAEQTPTDPLSLSAVDKLPVLGEHFRLLLVFRHGQHGVVAAAEAVREGLAKALVPYYPLAGRLGQSSLGETQLECSGDGVWFVEACTKSSLRDFDYFNDAANLPCDHLLPDDPSPDDRLDQPLVKVQVTQFACGGIVIGLCISHTVCDGLGGAQFLTAVGELARGSTEPKIAPVWSRHFTPPAAISEPNNKLNNVLTSPLSPSPKSYRKFIHGDIDISLTQIHNLKQHFTSVTNKNCSAFEIIAAILWKARAMAIGFEKETELKLVFHANCRQIVKPKPLPPGFYGNCIFPVVVTAPSNLIEQSSYIDIVSLIRSAKKNLPDQFTNYWKNGARNDLVGFSDVKGDPFGPKPSYETIFLTNWAHLGYSEVDYGFGPPSLVVPVQGSSVAAAGFMVMPPWPKDGVRLATWCMGEEHFESFMDQMTRLISVPV